VILTQHSIEEGAMRQTVTGRFKTWNDAVHAQDVLMLKGFAASDIELPANSPSVLAGIERLIASFFAGDPLARTPGTQDAGHTPTAAGDMVLVGVHVSDEDHAALARDTLRQEHALDVATRGAGWGWVTPDAPGAREHSVLDELGLAGFADAVRQRVATGSSQTHAAERAAASGASGNPGNEAEATVLTSASAAGAGAVMGHHVEAPGAPEATRQAVDAAPQIPDEFLEYEDDTPAHHRTLH
jgi:hypothetical protein